MNNINWDDVKVKWEDGMTSTELAKDLPCSRQNVDKRAKRGNWLRKQKADPNNWLERARSTYIVASKSSTIRTEENIAIVLDLISRGVGEGIAALTIGVSPNTMSRWKKEDPRLAQLMVQARSESLAKKISRIDRAGAAGNVKADMWYVERAPETRADFSQRVVSPGPVEFTFSFSRAPADEDEKVVCDVSPEEIVDDSVQGNGVTDGEEDQLPYDGPVVIPRNKYITKK